MRPSNLRPPQARPHKRVILVLAPLSSTKTNRSAGSDANRSCQRALFSATSGRFCSAAARVFFIPPAQSAKPYIHRGSPEVPVQACSQLGQRGVGLLREQFFQPLFPLRGEKRAASTAMGPRLERAALVKLLAHAAHRGHTKTKKLCDFASALTSLVELQNSLARRDRDGCHSPTLSQERVFVKLHHLWNCSRGSLHGRTRKRKERKPSVSN